MREKFISRKATWLLVGAGAAMVAGRLVERGLDSGYRAIRDNDPPEQPWKRGQSWPAALAWAAISAGAVAAAQLAARRGAHLGLQQLTGKRPPRSV
ncbi:MAG: DUF4235 domain-containing protein [Gemmatimonadaceae bacterium]